MKLVHYSNGPVGTLEMRAQPPGREFFKPHGLWLSDDDCEDNWRAWCIGESFGLERLTHVHDVDLQPDANVLVLRTASEIHTFTREWTRFDDDTLGRFGYPHWPDIIARYDGLIITPYVWSMRLDMGARWYYVWDCASGCIWHPRAVAAIRLREVVPVPEKT